MSNKHWTLVFPKDLEEGLFMFYNGNVGIISDLEIFSSCSANLILVDEYNAEHKISLYHDERVFVECRCLKCNNENQMDNIITRLQLHRVKLNNEFANYAENVASAESKEQFHENLKHLNTKGLKLQHEYDELKRVILE